MQLIDVTQIRSATDPKDMLRAVDRRVNLSCDSDRIIKGRITHFPKLLLALKTDLDFVNLGVAGGLGGPK